MAGSSRFRSDSASAFQGDTSTPSVASLPYGQCLVNIRWRGNKIMEEVDKSFTVHYTDETDFVDFQPSAVHLVSFLSEPEIVLGEENIRRKLASLYKFANKTPRSGILPSVIFQTTCVSSRYFYNIQNLCVLEFSIPIIPVDSASQIPQILERLKVTTRLKNPLKVDREPVCNTDKEMVLSLMAVPSINEKAARALLEHFGSVRGVAGAREEDLAVVVGAKLARGVNQFFTRKNTV